MEIEFFIIADAVEAVNGKLYVIGGAWDRYNAPAYPSPARLGVAAGILVDWNETNLKHALQVSIMDEDAKKIVPDINGQVEVGRPPGSTPGSKQRSLLAINANLQIPKPGRYQVRFAVGSVERDVTFEARLLGPLG